MAPDSYKELETYQEQVIGNRAIVKKLPRGSVHRRVFLRILIRIPSINEAGAEENLLRITVAGHTRGRKSPRNGGYQFHIDVSFPLYEKEAVDYRDTVALTSDSMVSYIVLRYTLILGFVKCAHHWWEILRIGITFIYPRVSPNILAIPGI